MSTAETADNAGKIAEEEPALEGSVVQEGERIRPAMCSRCIRANCNLCNGLWWDVLRNQTESCECDCNRYAHNDHIHVSVTGEELHRNGWQSPSWD